MPTITIEEAGCRGCDLCVEICPTDVLELEASKQVAKVARPDDCIGCASCMYMCPSRCLTVTEHVEQRPFHRIEQNAALIARFLQTQPVSAALTENDYQEALRDVHVRLRALGDAVTETMGRGQKAVGRAAGTMAASHLPEMYENPALPVLLSRLHERFARTFEFEPSVVGDGTEIVMRVPCCAFRGVVQGQKDGVGANVLCTLFHEYWAGLLGAFTGKNYTVDMLETGAQCTMKLQMRA